MSRRIGQLPRSLRGASSARSATSRYRPTQEVPDLQRRPARGRRRSRSTLTGTVCRTNGKKKFGLDAATADADADTDADGFTNAEEFAAGTDPSDKKSHPDYFDSLKLVMPLKETYLPFSFEY